MKESPQWMTEIYSHLSRIKAQPPLLVGVSGPQGCGKTTITRWLHQECVQHLNLRVVSMSLDDFYLPFLEQRHLSRSHQGNKLLEFRGLPGSHSLDLLSTVLQTLSENTPGKTVYIPRYDKSLESGRGDRLTQKDWTRVQLPVDLVLLEGWFVGFEALSNVDLMEFYTTSPPHLKLKSHPFEHLQVINNYLKLYQPIWSRMSHIYLAFPESLEYVYDWRLEQELSLQSKTEQSSSSTQESCGRGTLSKSQVVDFVDRFMPVYELYLTPDWITKQRQGSFTFWRMNKLRQVQAI